ncbi:butyrophilin subfamily 3 member A2-like isoform X2 [Eleginops maclovinus]|uniref:butyrophilin subfamily 3 member A2-like isoform X2 n=1 Tax=Eleginops maclovinus TaxID=56733 RepID=UPI0030803C2B
MMLLHTDGKPLKTHLRTLRVLVPLLLLTHHCRGQSQLIGSPQPIVAHLGSDIILACYLVPAVNVADLTLEWTRPDMDPRFVHVMRLGQEMVDKKHKLFEGRTSMFTDELKNGNISLKLSNVQLSDQGKYRCFIPELNQQAFVELVCASGPASPPVISISGVDGQTGGVVLQCESAGWYPEPEVLWLDAEEKLLSAGPPETVRGPDDLYTVSSRVTVEKRHSNSFTCRVQHHNTNRTTQTHLQVPDDFFIVPSSCIAPVAVSVLFGLMFVIAVVLFVWKWRQNINETKRNRLDQVDEGEGGQLMTSETAPVKDLERQEEKSKQLQEEKTRREGAEREVEDTDPQSDSSEFHLASEVNQHHHDMKEGIAKSQAGGPGEPLHTPHTQTSDSGFDIEVDQHGKYFRLRNTSAQDKQLGLWELYLQVNTKQPIKFTFKQSFILQAGESVRMCARGYGSNYSNTDLKWNHLKPWSSGDRLQFSLYSNTREIQHELCVTIP